MTPAAPTRITFFYPELSTYGASLSGRAGDDFTVPNSQTRLLAAYQSQPWEDFMLNFQSYAEYMHEYDAYLAALPAASSS